MNNRSSSSRAVGKSSSGGLLLELVHVELFGRASQVDCCKSSSM